MAPYPQLPASDSRNLIGDYVSYLEYVDKCQATYLCPTKIVCASIIVLSMALMCQVSPVCAGATALPLARWTSQLWSEKLHCCTVHFITYVNSLCARGQNRFTPHPLADRLKPQIKAPQKILENIFHDKKANHICSIYGRQNSEVCFWPKKPRICLFSPLPLFPYCAS